MPVYRYFLFGDPSLFRLKAASMSSLVGVSLVGLPVMLTMAGRIVSPACMIGLAISAAGVSLPLAALVTRWAGRSNGMLAGWMALAGWTALCCRVSPNVTLAAAAAIAAILAYGLAELPNRTEPVPRGPAAAAFYLGASVSCLCAGLAPLAPIAVVCLGAVIGNGNSRGMRFFVSPLGLAVLSVGVWFGISTAAAAGSQDSAPWFGPPRELQTLWPLAVALAAGLVLTCFLLRSGHGSSPLGRLLVSWLLGPVLLAITGVISTQLAAAITLPAWAAMMGPALGRLRRQYRAKRLFNGLPAAWARSA